MNIIKAGIIGGTGYTGVELLRLLAVHPNVEVVCVASRSEAGRKVSELYPNLRGHVDITFQNFDAENYASCDVVFSATPSGIAMQHAPRLLELGAKFIDLAADFRIRSEAQWSDWYGQEHACPELLGDAVYGLPELNRSKITTARLVANPGCYPTACALGFLPLLAHRLVNPQSLIADVKSGISGAGRNASVTNLFAELGDSFKAYAASGHRHYPELSQVLSGVSSDPIKLTFVPHLLPIIRGIHATLYADLKVGVSLERVHHIFREYYEHEPFVDLLSLGMHPETRSVKSSNMCRLALHQAAGSEKLVVLSVIDNLTKGAAGQAIQNMNLMFGLDESLGLNSPALLP